MGKIDSIVLLSTVVVAIIFYVGISSVYHKAYTDGYKQGQTDVFSRCHNLMTHTTRLPTRDVSLSKNMVQDSVVYILKPIRFVDDSTDVRFDLDTVLIPLNLSHSMCWFALPKKIK
jgi:hypothetical protein